MHPERRGYRRSTRRLVAVGTNPARQRSTPSPAAQNPSVDPDTAAFERSGQGLPPNRAVAHRSLRHVHQCLIHHGRRSSPPPTIHSASPHVHPGHRRALAACTSFLLVSAWLELRSFVVHRSMFFVSWHTPWHSNVVRPVDLARAHVPPTGTRPGRTRSVYAATTGTHPRAIDER
jgi:hypothetical protein